MVERSLRGRITLAVVTRDRPEAFARFILPSLAAIAAAAPVLVIDQSAGDETARLVEQFAGARLLKSEPGLARGRNLAVSETETPLLAFTDDDVTVPADWLGALAAAFDRASDAGAVCGRGLTPEGALLPGAPSGTYRWPTIPFALGSGFNLAFRREALEAVGPFDEDLGAGARYRAAEDSDMLYRLLKACWSVVCTDEITVTHYDERRGRDELRLHFGYGYGAGAQTAKHHRSGDGAAFRIGLRHARRHLVTLGRAALTLRPGLASLQLAYLSGAVAGYVRRWRSRGEAR